MSIKKRKISDFPAATTLEGFRVLGVNARREDVQADLGFVETAAKDARGAAVEAREAAQSIVEPLAVLAHSDCTLEERVAHLEQVLFDALSGRTYIPALKVRDFEAWGEVLNALTGAGAPSQKPDKVGQFYIDTMNRVLYFATGNSAVSDWKH